MLSDDVGWWPGSSTFLVCFAFFSTPARSCSEELFHDSSTLATKALATPSAATSDIITSGRHPTMTEQEEASVRTGVPGAPLVAEAARDETQGCQTLTSTKHIAAQSPSHFLPVPTAAATTATDTGRRKGRARSECDGPQAETSWLDSNLPATWATASNYTTFHEFPPRSARTRSFHFRIRGSIIPMILFFLIVLSLIIWT